MFREQSFFPIFVHFGWDPSFGSLVQIHEEERWAREGLVRIENAERDSTVRRSVRRDEMPRPVLPGLACRPRDRHSRRVEWESLLHPAQEEPLLCGIVDRHRLRPACPWGLGRLDVRAVADVARERVRSHDSPVRHIAIGLKDSIPPGPGRADSSDWAAFTKLPAGAVRVEPPGASAHDRRQHAEKSRPRPELPIHLVERVARAEVRPREAGVPAHALEIGVHVGRGPVEKKLVRASHRIEYPPLMACPRRSLVREDEVRHDAVAASVGLCLRQTRHHWNQRPEDCSPPSTFHERSIGSGRERDHPHSRTPPGSTPDGAHVLVRARND